MGTFDKRIRWLWSSLFYLACFSPLFALGGTKPLILSGDEIAGLHEQVGVLNEVDANDAGEVVFNGLFAGSQDRGAVFLLREGSVTTVMRADQETRGGGVFVGSYNPTINNRGEVLVRATIREDTDSESALYLSSAGSLDLVASQHQPVPELQTRLTGILDHSLNDKGEIVFLAATFAHNYGNTRGIFTNRDGNIVPLVVGGDRDAVGDIIRRPAKPSINDHGEVLFLDLVRGSPSGSHFGVRAFTIADTITPFVSPGDQLAGLGPARPRPARPMAVSNLNDNGSAVVVTAVGEGPAGGIFLRSEPGVEKIAVSRQRLGGLRLIDFEQPRLNSHGTVVFIARAQQQDDDTETEVLCRYQNGRISVLHEVNGSVPGLPGTSFAEFRAVDVNDVDQIVFTARTAGTLSGYGLFLVK